VLLYEIAQRELERAELIEQCSNAQRDLNTTRRSLLELDRRRDRRRDWLEKACRQRQSVRELRAAEEFLEGGHRGWDQDR
jgi:hypothetical protein